MFKPSYIITNKLLANIKKISSVIIELNNRSFHEVVIYELEKKAREISTYTSTSIEGNPLPLTDVKQIIKNNVVIIKIVIYVLFIINIMFCVCY